MICVEKGCCTLRIKEMSYEYDNKKGYFIKDRLYNLKTNYIGEKLFVYPVISPYENFCKVNFEKIFIDKKLQDKFAFKIHLIFSFDDEPEKSQTINYTVQAHKSSNRPVPLKEKRCIRGFQ